jgi:hypothetical protein
MKWLVLLALAGLCLAEDIPRIVFVKSFPGSDPAYVEISVDRDGTVGYKESADDDPENFKLDGDTTAHYFELADRLDHFKHPIESGLKVANMGVKTFRWEEGEQKSEVKFNYSVDENAKTLWDNFERIVESERLLIVLRRVVRHDHLGVQEALLNIQSDWDRRRLAGADQFLPLLDQVSKNEIFMHISRERAAQIAEAIRATMKSQ